MTVCNAQNKLGYAYLKNMTLKIQIFGSGNSGQKLMHTKHMHRVTKCILFIVLVPPIDKNLGFD